VFGNNSYLYQRLRAMYVIVLFVIYGSAVTPQQSVIAQAQSCPALLPTRLAIGAVATVSATLPGETAVPVRVHMEASVSSPVIAQFQTGDMFLIRSGPKCADGYRSISNR